MRIEPASRSSNLKHFKCQSSWFFPCWFLNSHQSTTSGSKFNPHPMRRTPTPRYYRSPAEEQFRVDFAALKSFSRFKKVKSVIVPYHFKREGGKKDNERSRSEKGDEGTRGQKAYQWRKKSDKFAQHRWRGRERERERRAGKHDLHIIKSLVC